MSVRTNNVSWQQFRYMYRMSEQQMIRETIVQRLCDRIINIELDESEFRGKVY